MEVPNTVARKLAILIGAAAMAAMLVLTSGAGAETTKQAPAKLSGKFTVGALAQLSGGAAWFGQTVTNGTTLALEDINRKGGVKGKEFVVKFRDLQGNPTVALSEFRSFLDVDKVPVVLMGTSFAVLGACDIAQSARNMIIVNDGASSPLIPKECGTKTYSTLPPSTNEMKTLATFIWKKQKLRKVAIFRVNLDVNQGISDSFKAAWKDLGGSIVSEQAAEPNTADFRSQIAALRSAGPDVVLLATEGQDAARFLNQARDLGFRTQFVSQSNAVNADVLAINKRDGLINVYTTVAFNPAGSTPIQKAFIARYNGRFEPTPAMVYAALAYDATRMIADAANKNGTTAAGILRYLRSLKSYTGVSGIVRYNKPGAPQRVAQLFIVKDGVARGLALGHR
jgi:branched-chain amino acid transport system substrate-binding protein